MSQDDLNALLSGAVDVATDRLADETEFAPFALAMRADDGEIFHLEPEEGDGDDPQEVLALLVAGLREGALEGKYRAVALVSDVTLEDDAGEPVASAIHVALEHTESDPLVCLVPYTIDEDNVEIGDLSAEPGERRVFVEVLEN